MLTKIRKIRSSLTLKASAVIIVAIAIGIMSLIFLNQAGDAAVRKIYSSHEDTVERLETLEEDLRETVNPNGKSCNSFSEIRDWLKEKPGVSLDAYNASSKHLIYESDGNFDTMYRNGESKTTMRDGLNYFPLIYMGSTIYVVLRDTSYQTFMSIAAFTSLLISFCITLIIIVVILKKYFINRIINLSKQVNAVALGETDREIHARGTDEIAKLGDSIDAMRLSISEHYEKEQSAIKANNELLTSISHDIRTPLTSIIGYAEMMTDEYITDTEELKKYAEICKDKAYRLKELTDAMFRYFYVYGREQTDLRLERYDAKKLFMQIIGEHIVDIMSDGYDIRVPVELEEQAFIMIDIDLFKRVFDNIFSNLEKYADKSKPITIKGYLSNGKVYITFENSVRESANQTESTKIGLKTCARAMTQVGGSFSVESDGKIFKEIITIPLTE